MRAQRPPTPRFARPALHPLLDGIRMARWPQHVWTTLFTYTVIFVGFPLLCLMFWRWVRG